MSNTKEVQALTDMDHAPERCVVIVATLAAKLGSTSIEDDVLRLTANGQGNTEH